MDEVFTRWHGRDGQVQNLRDIGAPRVKAGLTILADERKVFATSALER